MKLGTRDYEFAVWNKDENFRSMNMTARRDEWRHEKIWNPLNDERRGTMDDDGWDTTMKRSGGWNACDDEEVVEDDAVDDVVASRLFVDGRARRMMREEGV